MIVKGGSFYCAPYGTSNDLIIRFSTDIMSLRDDTVKACHVSGNGEEKNIWKVKINY